MPGDVVDEKLAEARALIEEREYERALEVLTDAGEAVRAGDDACTLGAIQSLAGQVSERALRRSDRERADVLRRCPTGDAPAAGSLGAGVRRALRGWTLIALGTWLAASLLVTALVLGSVDSDAFISPGVLALLLVLSLAGIALVAWVAGVVIVLRAYRVPLGDVLRRGWLGRWSVVVVAAWLVLSVRTAPDDIAASRVGRTLVNLGLYGAIALGVWLLGVLVHRGVARRT